VNFVDKLDNMKYYLPIIFLLFSSNLKSQKKTSKFYDNTFKEKKLLFLKVKPTFQPIDTVFLTLSTTTNGDSILLEYKVPSYWYRYKTTLNDYFILKSKASEYKFFNEIETINQGNYYVFTSRIQKNTFLSISNDKIKFLKFYFTPNDEIEKRIREINKDKKINELDRHQIRLAKISFKVKVTDFTLSKQKEIIEWLDNL
jgi:hypothetical protein